MASGNYNLISRMYPPDTHHTFPPEEDLEYRVAGGI